MPVPSGRAALMRLALDIGDLGISFDRVKELVDDDLAEAAGEAQMIGGRDVLIAEEDHPVVTERRADIGQLGAFERLRVGDRLV